MAQRNTNAQGVSPRVQSNGHHEAVVVSTVDINAPLRWLKLGWEDLIETRFKGVFYGVVFATMGYLITLQYDTKWQLTMGLVSGFFLMGPFVCAGLYGLSQQLERGQKPSLLRSLTCWRNNLGSIAFFAVILTFLMIVWARVSVILFALSSPHTFPTLQGVLGNVFSPQNPQFLLLWVCVGFVFASVVFAVGVVAVPLMLDRNRDTILAMFSSAKVLRANPKPLYLWAFLVVLIIGASLMLYFLPLIVTAPVVGHATWHAYRDLVEIP